MRDEGFSREGPIYENIHAPLRHTHSCADTRTRNAGVIKQFSKRKPQSSFCDNTHSADTQTEP